MSFTFREEIADVTTVPGGDVIFPTSVTTYIELSRVFEKVLKFGIFKLICKAQLGKSICKTQFAKISSNAQKIMRNRQKPSKIAQSRAKSSKIVLNR